MQLKALAHDDSVVGNSSLNLGDSVINLYDMICNSVNSQQGNSYLKALKITDFRKLLLSACIF